MKWTEQEKDLIEKIFIVTNEFMYELEKTHEVAKWKALEPIRQQLNEIILATSIKDLIIVKGS